MEAGWPVDKVIDSDGKYNAVTLACHLDRLEMLHCLDLHGADLSSGAGKFKNTPLMAALMRWNVRILDYLMVRGVDPYTKDVFGFTAGKKAEIKNLRNTVAMLQDYEMRYVTQNPTSAITNAIW